MKKLKEPNGLIVAELIEVLESIPGYWKTNIKNDNITCIHEYSKDFSEDIEYVNIGYSIDQITYSLEFILDQINKVCKNNYKKDTVYTRDGKITKHYCSSKCPYRKHNKCKAYSMLAKLEPFKHNTDDSNGYIWS